MAVGFLTGMALDSDGTQQPISQIKVIHEGSFREVDSVYKGGTIIWRKGGNTTVFESHTPGNYSVFLPKGKYRVTITGAGGGTHWQGGH